MANRPTRRFRLARRLASGLVACALACASHAETPDDAGSDAAEIIDDAGVASGGGDALYLEVVVNGNETRKLAAFAREGDDLETGADTLRQLGFRVPAGDSRVKLGALPGVSYRYDESRQRLAPPRLLVDGRHAHRRNQG